MRERWRTLHIFLNSVRYPPMAFRFVAHRQSTQCARRGAAAIVAGGCLAFFVVSSGSASAQGKDDLWEVTTKMEMPGMPMAMPAQTNRSCVAKGGQDEDYIPRRENCKVLESKRVGNKVTFKMACTGKDPMTVVGETTFTATSYDGKMAMSGKLDNQPYEMRQTYSAKRIGDCTVAK